MNIILLEENECKDLSNVVLKGRRFRHIKDILKAKDGDSLEVGEINGQLGTAQITHSGDQYVHLHVKWCANPPKPLDVTLILALPRPIVLKRILSTVASMGIKKIILIQSNRVEKSYWKSPVLDLKKVREQFLLGLEQGKDTILPDIEYKKRFRPFVEDELPEIINGTVPLVAHPQENQSALVQSKKPITLMIGPEGGFVPYELEKVCALGFQSFSIGERILRVETAVTASISKLFF